jgi:hypothetical protein
MPQYKRKTYKRKYPSKKRKVMTKKFTTTPYVAKNKRNVAQVSLNLVPYFGGFGSACPFPSRVIHKMRMRNSGYLAVAAGASNSFTLPINNPWVSTGTNFPNADNTVSTQQPTGMNQIFAETYYNSYRVIYAAISFMYIPGTASTAPCKWYCVPISQDRGYNPNTLPSQETQPYYKENVYYTGAKNTWMKNSVTQYELLGITKEQFMQDGSNKYNGWYNNVGTYQPPSIQPLDWYIGYQTQDRAVLAGNSTWEYVCDYIIEFYNLQLSGLVT